jgi:predicted ATPase/DNA-binding SARP family transcriptional activator
LIVPKSFREDLVLPPTLEISTFGGLVLRRNGEPLVGLASRKAEALLIYLACTGRPQPRDLLATLLWDGRSQEQAMGNLRVLLSSLRNKLSPHLIITRQTVEFDRSSAYQLDSAEFERRILNARARLSPTKQLSSAGAREFEEALAWYRGDFLIGFSIRGGMEFDEWVVLERERLQHMAVEALHDLTEHYIAQEAYPAGLSSAARLLQIDPLYERAHQQMMLLHARVGQRQAALQQYDEVVAILRDELGVEPAIETTQLAACIRQGEIASAMVAAPVAPLAAPVAPPTPLASTVAPGSILPLYLTSFVGREEELRQIGARLSQPTCRLLTLHGPGGVGKTRLALRVVETARPNFKNGVCFVPLDGVRSAAQLPRALATALGFPFHEGDGAPQLVNWLAEREILLLLDNAEHLLDAAPFLLLLLQRAPRLKLLLTSRIQLSCEAEWRVEVRGLRYASVSEESGLAEYDATQLFVERAAHLIAGFKLHPDNQQAILQICQLLEGMPLGLELAASWVSTYSCTRIAQQIEHDWDWLTSTRLDTISRHASLRQLFDHSWMLLDAEEQRVLRHLAVLEGAFPPQAAEAVAATNPLMLARLVGHSLLRRSQADDLQLVPRLRQYAAEKLADHPNERRTATARWNAWREQGANFVSR